ncbi:hypothetical protein B0H63DRAFT_281985 [Podospora didyma]|uniref:Uncharacterized protein n=1 Tax=Podospora didyma TaxID=330526 RepID=A0AAE0K858_9PEZI|nr:hypothetical protein B0H63DRAFT_281985 [Podospora didyma]
MYMYPAVVAAQRQGSSPSRGAAARLHISTSAPVTSRSSEVARLMHQTPKRRSAPWRQVPIHLVFPGMFSYNGRTPTKPYAATNTLPGGEAQKPRATVGQPKESEGQRQSPDRSEMRVGAWLFLLSPPCYRVIHANFSSRNRNHNGASTSKTGSREARQIPHSGYGRSRCHASQTTSLLPPSQCKITLPRWIRAAPSLTTFEPDSSIMAQYQMRQYSPRS